MESFLRSSRDAIKNSNQDGPGIHVVMGNEACDLDSMVSALTFAYFLSKTLETGKVAVPVLNIRREEFPLRTDNAFLLKETSLATDLLLFRDDLDLHAAHRAKRLTLTLVDHNILPSGDASLEDSVVEVIDHHLLERKPSPSCPVTVETVGSCATLVLERIAQKSPDILDQQVAQLLYGTIVLDCVNMAPEAGKVTPKDSQYASMLEARFPNLPPRGALFQSLQNAKFDVSGLTTEQMLLKDMKAATGADLNLAVSVVYMTLEAFLQRRSLQQELCEFCHKYKYNLLVAMTISFSENNEPFRQLAVYSSSTLYRDEMSRALERAQTPSLSLSPMSSPYPDVKAYAQGNTLASRKKVLPIIKDFLKYWEKRTAPGGNLDELGDLEGEAEAEGEGEALCCPGMEQGRRYHSHRCTEGDGEAEEEVEGEGDGEKLPPTPMNSLVEGCPLDQGLPRLTQEAIVEKFSRMASQENDPQDKAGQEGV
ncbi:exopolyphosphatase PRUNE1 isoform X2 [Engraulis encrasicolus]|uniref:exopolyphosphatase PRUNE1 isoform X2 n=1 Tax=Engraulis encrasicolus TaxID=184585 RepID=UPI002FD12C1F